MLILVCGVGGFIGEHVMHGFLNAGHSVIGVYRKTILNYAHPNLMLVQNLNLSSINTLAKIDAIVDCSAEIPAKQKDQNKLYLNNTQSLKLLLEFASEKNIKKIIYMSSMAAFGVISCKVVSSTTKDGDRTPYGSSKAYCEELIREWTLLSEKRSSLVIRLPGIVGNKSHDNFISDVYQKIHKGVPLKIYNKNSLFNNVVHIETLVEFLLKLVIDRNLGYTNLLIGSKCPVTIGDVIQEIYSLQMKHPIIEWKESNSSFIIDFESSENLGFAPLTTINSINKFTIERQFHEAMLFNRFS